MDIRADSGVGPSSGSIVETIVLSETTITAKQRLWPPAERNLNINLATGAFDLRISNGDLKYVKGICDRATASASSSSQASPGRAAGN